VIKRNTPVAFMGILQRMSTMSSRGPIKNSQEQYREQTAPKQIDAGSTAYAQVLVSYASQPPTRVHN